MRLPFSFIFVLHILSAQRAIDNHEALWSLFYIIMSTLILWLVVETKDTKNEK